jgi:hypothetical protein
MSKTERKCFVIMPFLAELHYFYLFMQRHIEEKHGLVCKRGDEDVLTVPLLDKIREYIAEADVLIADCSGKNPNVFYELGMAHSLGKKVILITKDSIEEAPVDIRHYEFIRYDLAKHQEFFDSLDKALRAVFIDHYEHLYKKAIEVFQEFRQRTKSRAKMASKEVFIERVIVAEQRSEIPSSDNEPAIREFLLPKIVSDKDDMEIIRDMNDWFQNEITTGNIPHDGI